MKALLLILIIFLQSISNNFAETVVLRGSGNLKQTNADGATEFEFEIDKCNWIIRLLNFPTNNFIQSQIGFFDGKTLGFITYLNTNFISKTTSTEPKTTKKAENIGDVILEEKTVPPEDEFALLAVWLAFASKCYFSENTNSFPYVFGNGNGQLRDIVKYSLKVIKETAPPFLPKEIEFFSDGIDLPITGTSLDERLQPPFDKGFLLARFKSEGFNEFQGHSIPKTFSLDIYLPKSTALHSNEVEVAYSVQADLASFEIAKSTSYENPPRLLGKVYVQDRRFSSATPKVPYVFYFSTNKVAETSNTNLLNVYKEHAESLRAKNTQTLTASGKFPKILILLIVIAAFPLINYVFKRKK